MDLKILQYQRNLSFPIYVQVDLSAVDEHLFVIMNSMGFSLVLDKELKQVNRDLKKRPYARILKITKASLQVQKQITSMLAEDYLGMESLILRNGFSVYRYKNLVILLYSFAVKEWKIGCLKEFGSKKNDVSTRIILNRFLSWSLSAMGIIGFWGIKLEKGMAVVSSDKAKGKVFFFDIFNKKFIFDNTIGDFGSDFYFYGVDKVNANNEEFMAFLSRHCSYIDSRGFSAAINQMLIYLSYSKRNIIPKELISDIINI